MPRGLSQQLQEEFNSNAQLLSQLVDSSQVRLVL